MAAAGPQAFTSSPAPQQTATLPNGPGGFAYVPAGSPGFAAQSIIVAEWRQSGQVDDRVAVYEADADDTSTAEAATTGSPAVATNPNTTLSVAAGVGDQSITVTSATGFAVDGRYLLTAAAGHREEIEVAGITGSVLTLRHPLINAYLVTTSTVATTRCTQAVDATWIADLQNISPGYGPNPRYRVRWVVTLSGVSQVYDRYLDVVRYPARHNVSPLDVERRHPGWLDGLRKWIPRRPADGG